MENTQLTLSIRCKMIVKATLENFDLYCNNIKLDKVEVMEDMLLPQREQLRVALLNSGLELPSDPKVVLVEKIKSAIIEIIHYDDELPKMKYSAILSKKLNRSYTYLANIFSEIMGMSIRQFILTHRIERVKELLKYKEYTLSEIAAKLHYSSVAHLSHQFKQITGHTPSDFKIGQETSLLS